MTSIPASRSARATTFAPRSWPSSPGFAISTRIGPVRPRRTIVLAGSLDPGWGENLSGAPPRRGSACRQKVEDPVAEHEGPDRPARHQDDERQLRPDADPRDAAGAQLPGDLLAPGTVLLRGFEGFLLLRSRGPSRVAHPD